MIRRIRYALLVLVAAGSVLNLWTALDAISHVPAYDAMVNAGIVQAPTPNPIDALRQTPGDPVALFLARRKAEAQYNSARGFAIWERAAEIEFAVLAVALCVWLLLPRTKRQTHESV